MYKDNNIMSSNIIMTCQVSGNVQVGLGTPDCVFILMCLMLCSETFVFQLILFEKIRYKIGDTCALHCECQSE
jgi:hypothetical protein